MTALSALLADESPVIGIRRPDRAIRESQIEAGYDRARMLRVWRLADNWSPTSLAADAEEAAPVRATENEPRHVLRQVSTAASSADRLFDAKVQLKVATAHYAMHLTNDARKRLFGEFDYLLDEEAWDPDDKLPSVDSYRQFIRWMIFTADTTWSSLGVADNGNVLAAWVHGDRTMTANFGARVKWSQRYTADGEMQLAAGEFSLEHFARVAQVFLSGI